MSMKARFPLLGGGLFFAATLVFAQAPSTSPDPASLKDRQAYAQAVEKVRATNPNVAYLMSKADALNIEFAAMARVHQAKMDAIQEELDKALFVEVPKVNPAMAAFVTTRQAEIAAQKQAVALRLAAEAAEKDQRAAVLAKNEAEAKAAREAALMPQAPSHPLPEDPQFDAMRKALNDKSPNAGAQP